MIQKTLPTVDNIKLDKIVGGGQTLGTMADGRKIFVWGGLPDETVNVQLTKKKSKLAEGIVIGVTEPSKERIEPKDPASYLSTSPWQIMTFDAEQHYKADLIRDAFELNGLKLPDTIDVFTDQQIFGYRNKVEFSWWQKDNESELNLAFFRRGSHGKIAVDSTSLADPRINQAAIATRDLLRSKNISAYALKTLLIRCDRHDGIVAQLYVKDQDFAILSDEDIKSLNVSGFELIFSNPKCPASVITKRLQKWGKIVLSDTILDVSFSYTAESFFQINLPVYEQALRDMQSWVGTDRPVVDLYSGVGTIGLTIGGSNVKMIESNPAAVEEMKKNITALGRTKAKAVLAPSEKALSYIETNSTIIVDPPRAGLHDAVIAKLLEAVPSRIVYLSCNPVTQSRDIAKLLEKYTISYHRGYNFFPRTPHIEHLVVLEYKANI
jgi:23S rRNA (uracil1939-C5)-methyltransferase